MDISVDMSLYEGVDAESVRKRLEFLYGTTQGTCPMDREFGIDADIVDRPLPVAVNLLSVSIEEQTAKYEPNVEIGDIQTEMSPEGIITAKVVIHNVGD